MSINHAPDMDAREPKDGDLETFEALENGDTVTFFEWPVAPLEVVDRVEDENVGEAVRVESEGEESYLYEVDGHLWHYVDEEKYAGENNPYPVQSLRKVDQSA